MTCETAGGRGVGPAVIRYCLTYGLAIALDPTQQPEAEPLSPARHSQHRQRVGPRVERVLRNEDRVALTAPSTEEVAAARRHDSPVDGYRQGVSAASSATADVPGHEAGQEARGRIDAADLVRPQHAGVE